MKQLLALLLAAFMMLALVACGGKPADTTTGGTTTGETTSNETTSAETTTEETTEPEKPTEPEKTLPEIIDSIYEIYPVKFKISTTECDLTDPEMLKYQIGLESVDKVLQAYTAGAMMTSQAYELALVRVKDAADAEDIAREILEGANPKKWVCVWAESVRVAVSGDMILLVMASDEATTGLVDAFKTVCGGELDLSLKK